MIPTNQPPGDRPQASSDADSDACERARTEAFAAISAKHRADNLTDARAALHKLLLLTEVAAPDTVKTHYLVYIAVPRLARLWGVENLTSMVAGLLARGLAVHAGVCARCMKERALHQSEEHLCPACLVEVREMEEAMERLTISQQEIEFLLAGGQPAETDPPGAGQKGGA